VDQTPAPRRNAVGSNTNRKDSWIKHQEKSFGSNTKRKDVWIKHQHKGSVDQTPTESALDQTPTTVG
jgi:hypothetical protein